MTRSLLCVLAAWTSGHTAWADAPVHPRTGGAPTATEGVIARPTREPEVRAPYRGDVAAPPVLHWRVALPGGPITSAAHHERVRPVLFGRLAYVGSAEGDALYAVERTSGRVVQTFPATTSVEIEPYVDAQRVVFGDTGGHLWAYAQDGTLLWTKDVGAPILSKPWVDDDVIAVASVGDVVAAYATASGDLLWRHTHKAGLFRKATLALYVSSPVVRMGDLLLGGFSDGRLVALDRMSGEVRWQLAIGEGDYPDVVAPPDVGAAPVLVTSGYFEPTVAYDTEARKLLWTSDHGSAAAVARVTDASGRGRVIQPGTDGVLRALDALSGEEVWNWASGTEGALTEPVPTPAGLLVGSQAGTLWLIDPDVGAPTWSFDPGYVVEGLAAAPAVDGRQIVFATNGGNLYSLVTPSPAEDGLRSGWPNGRAVTHAAAPRTYREAKAVTARAPKEKREAVSNVPLDKPADDAPLAPEDIERPR
ncbi:MAG: hypothetical protein RLZZ383_969 [Pseudomonadota bacterium]